MNQLSVQNVVKKVIDMQEIKSYTDLSQSLKLAEILPIESADMHYNNASIKGINYVDEYRAELMDYNTAQKVLSKYLINPMFGVIPCWSLATLLVLLPKGHSLGRRTNGKYYVCMTHIKHNISEFDNPVDACVAMIKLLHEQKLL